MTVEIEYLHGADPVAVDATGAIAQEALAALEEIWGNRALRIRSGGSIPIVGTFSGVLDVPVLLMGFGLEDDRLHSPNEKFNISHFYSGIRAVARFLDRLALMPASAAGTAPDGHMTATHKKPQIERELKFAGVDLDQLRSRLLELECERVGPPSNEDNWLLDRKGELLASGGVLRVRQDGRGALITFKGPASFDGPAKLRRELEIEVEDSESALALFTALGYEVVRRYQKIREEWRLGSEIICLDHTPIGDFVEFEGAKAEAVAKRCGFDLATSLRKSYLMLYEDYIAEHPDAPRDMIFRDGS